MHHNIVPVILCGGSGTRLWPLSRENYPKQFVNLGAGHTLFSDTLKRISLLPDNPEPVIVCNEEHRFYVAAELSKYSMDATVILEPERRNTAPALALASLSICSNDPQALMLVLPSDHSINDSETFIQDILNATTSAEAGNIVSFGVKPTSAETGFGYIQKGDQLNDNSYRVTKFIEKPDFVLAEKMLHQDDYYWNSGMFLLRAQFYLDELYHYSPKIYDSCLKSWEKRKTGKNFIRPDKDLFLSSPEDSIDYAVMEHTQYASMVPLNTQWSDLGSWEAFYKNEHPDSHGNVISGDVITDNVHNCYCHSQDRLIAALGVTDLCIIETRDAILIVPRSQTQNVKKIAQRLQKEGRSEYREHPLVYRPWGSYEILTVESRFQVKRIIVNPGAELSLQMHHHRAEHWVIVSGTAEVTINDKTQLLIENQSTYIPVGSIHRLRNPGVIPLVLIEIQSGSYLGEDDIVRYEDNYGREK